MAAANGQPCRAERYDDRSRRQESERRSPSAVFPGALSVVTLLLVAVSQLGRPNSCVSELLCISAAGCLSLSSPLDLSASQLLCVSAAVCLSLSPCLDSSTSQEYFSHSLSFFSHNHTLTHSHSLSLVLVVMIKSKELKTKISHSHSLILSFFISPPAVFFLLNLLLLQTPTLGLNLDDARLKPEILTQMDDECITYSPHTLTSFFSLTLSHALFHFSLALDNCVSLSTHTDTHTHIHLLSLTVMLKSKELKTKIYSHADSLILSTLHSASSQPACLPGLWSGGTFSSITLTWSRLS